MRSLSLISFLLLFGAALFAVSSSAAVADEVAAAPLDGRQVYVDRTCWHCHGMDANQPAGPQYPKLAGQSLDYLLAQMLAIRSGERNSGLSSMMAPLMEDMSLAELEAVALYLADLGG